MSSCSCFTRTSSVMLSDSLAKYKWDLPPQMHSLENNTAPGIKSHSRGEYPAEWPAQQKATDHPFNQIHLLIEPDPSAAGRTLQVSVVGQRHRGQLLSWPQDQQEQPCYKLPDSSFVPGCQCQSHSRMPFSCSPKALAERKEEPWKGPSLVVLAWKEVSISAGH